MGCSIQQNPVWKTLAQHAICNSLEPDVPLTGVPFLVFSIAYLIPTYLSRLLNLAFSRKPILATPTHFSFLALQAVPVSHLSVIEY